MVKKFEQFFSEHCNYTQLGFSLKGNGKNENQDNFEFFHDDNCIIAVVADGLGSAIYSGNGSAVICTSAIEILKKTESTSNLARDIRDSWIEKVKHKPIASDTTLKFVKITHEKAIMGGVGDGWIAFLSDEEYISLNAENSFANQTDTIMSSNLSDKFIIKELSLNKNNCLFLIATDGFSEDIDKSKGKQFLDTIKDSLEADSVDFCNKLEDTLTNWPVKTSSDDKTVVLLKRGAKA